jgi:hypothetical protein
MRLGSQEWQKDRLISKQADKNFKLGSLETGKTNDQLSILPSLAFHSIFNKILDKTSEKLKTTTMPDFQLGHERYYSLDTFLCVCRTREGSLRLLA